jgi:hypothetical protein
MWQDVSRYFLRHVLEILAMRQESGNSDIGVWQRYFDSVTWRLYLLPRHHCVPACQRKQFPTYWRCLCLQCAGSVADCSRGTAIFVTGIKFWAYKDTRRAWRRQITHDRSRGKLITTILATLIINLQDTATQTGHSFGKYLKDSLRLLPTFISTTNMNSSCYVQFPHTNVLPFRIKDH